MTAISSWAVVICIAAVICGVLELLAPSSRMNGILRFVFGGFMLCAVIVPLSEIGFHEPWQPVLLHPD